MAYVPNYEEFEALVTRVKALEAETVFFRSILMSRRSLSRKEAAAARGLSVATLYDYARSGKLVPAYEGKKPVYPAQLIYDYLAKRNFSKIDAEKALIQIFEGKC